ncbi:MAG: ABC transporter ATP-binding protein/permease [Lachnospiraceae bacterium]|nr:ABC transporter ATP-binding protein/permease [Lachnospiraceae bacterium]
MIRLTDLHKYYYKGKQNEIHVIDDVSLELPDSGMVAIFGPSGCGKTTLLNVIGGLDTVNSGVINVNEDEMRPGNDIVRNREIGMIFQNYNLNREETVAENVADALRLCGMKDEEMIKARVNAALANVGMEKFAKRLPDTLSGGQQQRVAIARAIVKNPRVILADEPTGNLDESNTILVMDILKEISKEHLVLLVTHEANLVDFYCDKVIELRDGRVIGARENTGAAGYVARDKNDIFLGELEETISDNGKTDVRYYGEQPEEPIRITVVNHNGRMFLKIDTPKVTVLDENSEVKLREGVYEAREQKQKRDSDFTMEELPPFEGSEYGKLFNFKNSVKSGYRSNYKSMMQKKGKKRLRNCLALFGATLVFLTAIFGRAVREYSAIKDCYNENVFFLAASIKDISERIKEAAADPESGIDSYEITWLDADPYGADEAVGDKKVEFKLAKFESSGLAYDGFSSQQSISREIALFADTMVRDANVVAGRGGELQDDEMIITTRIADLLLKDTPYKYIDNYDKLIGMQCNMMEAFSLTSKKVVGIVESDEIAGYVSDYQMALSNMYYSYFNLNNVSKDMDGYFNLEPGEIAVIRVNHSRNVESFYELSVGEELVINGIKVKVKSYYDISYNAEEDDDPEINPDEDPKDALRVELRKHLRTEGRLAYRDREDRFLDMQHKVIVMNAQDYREAFRVIGPTSARLQNYYDGDNVLLPIGGKSSDVGYSATTPYYQLHSVDPDKTKAYLESHFSDVVPSEEALYYVGSEELKGLQPIYTPEDRFEILFRPAKDSTVTLAIIWLCVLGFLCVCMYFIMKSTFMSRYREIGIYRAIGASKKNILFRFVIETGVVVTLSVMIGYLFASILVRYLANASSLLPLYYPIWMAFILVALLYVICIVAGMIPLIALLRKTPSEILAKYDI